MKKIEVIFRPEKLEALKNKLIEAGVNGVSIHQVHGCGNQHGWIQYHRGSEVMMNTLSKVYLMTVVSDDDYKKIIKLIKDTVYTGEYGDGKIFVYPVEEAVRIRTGETGENAL